METPNFYKDDFLRSLLPFWRQISWGNHEDSLKDIYETEAKLYLITREKKWKELAEEAFDRVLSPYRREWDKVWIHPIQQFIERWRLQCENSFLQCKAYRNYSMTPAEWDIKKYFSFDQSYYPSYATYYFMQYMEEKRLHPKIIPDVKIVTPDGKDALPMIKKHIEERLSEQMEVFRAAQKKNYEAWDKEVGVEEEQIIKSLSGVFDEIWKSVEDVIFSEYLQYLLAMQGSKYIKDISQYIISCGKLSKTKVELMSESLPTELFGYTILFQFSDGSRIKDKVKVYIKKRTEEIRNQAKEKLLHERE